jgi:hypothetical protein
MAPKRKRARGNSPLQRNLTLTTDRVNQFQYQVKEEWEDYTLEVNAELCRVFLDFMRDAGNPVVPFERYTIDLDTFSQTNNETGHTRRIRLVRS